MRARKKDSINSLGVVPYRFVEFSHVVCTSTIVESGLELGVQLDALE